jgi:hypothetical protein
MSYWLAEVWIRIQDILVVLPISLFHVENRVCLSRGVQVINATWQVAIRIMTEVGDLVQRTGDGQVHVGCSVARRSRGRVTPCTVCTVDVETRSVSFLFEPQNQDRWFVSSLASNQLIRFSGLDLKTDSYSLMIWVSKSPWRFLSLDLKTKRATIYRMRHKTDERMKTASDMHRDLAACFT